MLQATCGALIICRALIILISRIPDLPDKTGQRTHAGDLQFMASDILVVGVASCKKLNIRWLSVNEKREVERTPGIER